MSLQFHLHENPTGESRLAIQADEAWDYNLFGVIRFLDSLGVLKERPFVQGDDIHSSYVILTPEHVAKYKELYCDPRNMTFSKATG